MAFSPPSVSSCAASAIRSTARGMMAGRATGSGATRSRSTRPATSGSSDPVTTILGISAYYHDSAACLVRDGEIVAAAQEERFTRKKHAASFPRHAVACCLAEGKVQPEELDYVGFYDKPLLKFERLLENYCGVAPRGLRSFLTAMPVWLKEKLFTRDQIRKALGGYEGPVLFAEHHESHAASAFYPSPFLEAAGLTMTNGAFDRLFGGPPRRPESEVTQREMDVAASVQVVTEEIVLRMARHVHRESGLENLCLAGGVALNCVGNGRLLREGPFKRLWIQPAAGDAGGALGVALTIYHKVLGNERRHVSEGDAMKGSYLGPVYSDAEIERFLVSVGAVYEKLAEGELIDRAGGLLAAEKVVGWFQGRMEFGPRALGNRSILGDARSPRMQAVMNLKIKFRESFRPFAPSVLRARVADWFELDVDSPYMLLVAPVRRERRIAMTEAQQRLFGIEKLNVPRSEIPAATHVDYSARIQTVHRDTNPF